MQITGIICEYNPMHHGHKKQIDLLRSQQPDAGIVCLMSGNFVQRGLPAIVDKSLRAKAAVQCGADLVLEMPLTASLSSAEGFASEGVCILSGFCDSLCFGAETGTLQTLMNTAHKLLSPAFSESLRQYLDKGLSFPAARQAALGDGLLSRPNDILAVEYCKAIIAQSSKLLPIVIHREGDYHDTAPDPENPSATSIRNLMLESGSWLDYIPLQARVTFQDAPIHTLASGEKAILATLRSMTESEFEALPHGSEGLWRKFMRAVREQATVEDILTAVKSRRYTRTRLNRMLMCAFLGISQEMLCAPAPYVRVLALNDRGRDILKTARQSGTFLNTGESTDTEYQHLEDRCGDLYGLFAQAPEMPGSERKRRVIYIP